MGWRSILLAMCISLTACVNRQCLDTPGTASGAALFRINCAGCHGTDARGNGSVAEFINAPVPDLTRISVRNGGEYPTERIFQVIDGQSGTNVHGERHMPIWGYEFFGPEADDAKAHLTASQKVDRLVHYLRVLQAEK